MAGIRPESGAFLIVGSDSERRSSGSTLWLVGMMGSGKTVVGGIIARRCSLPFTDTDAEIEKAAGCSVAEIWANEGEPGFRRREAETLERVAGVRGVVATGGGAVLADRNVDLMRRSGTVVWLDADAATLGERISDGRDRPLLTSAPDPVDALRRIGAERRARYERSAHFQVATDGLTPDEVATEVVGLWNRS